MGSSDINIKLSNEELLKLYRETNNRRYLDVLFRNVENLIYYTCTHTSSGKKLMNVYKLSLDEVKSIAFLGVSKVINNFSFEKNVKFSTAMYGYIIHEFYKSFDYYNRKNREINLESLQISYSQNDNMSTPATVAEQLKDDTIDIEEQVLDKIEYQDYLVKLHKALEVIPERSRLIIHEYYFNNKICKDISKIVNLNTNSVNRLKVQIVNELKQMITDPSYINVIKAKEEAKALGVLRNLPKNYEDFTHLLTKKEKIALDMKLEGKTYKDIALVLKINKHTTGSVLARVANKLNDASMRASGNCKTRDFYESLYNKYPKYLREISTSDQLLLNLKYKDKKKYSEIANILNRKETAVCVLIRNAEYRFGNVITSHEEI